MLASSSQSTDFGQSKAQKITASASIQSNDFQHVLQHIVFIRHASSSNVTHVSAYLELESLVVNDVYH